MSNKYILEVKNLSVYFGTKKSLILNSFKKQQKNGIVRAVDNVNFNIKRGDVLGLVGETGCGKTTIGKTILLLNKPTGGDIYFLGNSINDINKKTEMLNYYKKVQIIFQDPYSSLNPSMSLNTILKRPLIKLEKMNQYEIESRINKILKLCGLSKNDLKKYPHEFSGGQRQRLCIARALLTEPIFIVADEPTSALDMSIQAKILNLLRDIIENQKLSMLFISHDISSVLFISNRIAVMYNGNIVELMNKKDLLENAIHPYTKKLMSVIPKGPNKKNKKDKRIVLLKNNSKQKFLEKAKQGEYCIYVKCCPIAEKICYKKKPVLYCVGNDHFVACHKGIIVLTN